MSRIVDLPPDERPREKAVKYGIVSLSNAEVLALIIGSGVQHLSAIDIGNDLLTEFKGLHGLVGVSYQNLLKQKGLKQGNALRLLAAFELIKRMEKATSESGGVFHSASEIFQKYKTDFSSAPQEMLLVIMMNRQNRVLKEEIIYRGSVSSMMVSSREIFVRLFVNETVRFVLVHNHPGGFCEPSKEDIAATISLKKEATKLGLHLIDHIVIANHDYYSMAEHKLL